MIYGISLVAGSTIEVPQGPNVGVYYGAGTAGCAVALDLGQSVGPSNGTNFLYSAPGLAGLAVIHLYSTSSPEGAGDPAWIDGQHHFLGVDLVSGSDGTDHHYGWVELSLQPSTTPTVTASRALGPW